MKIKTSILRVRRVAEISAATVRAAMAILLSGCLLPMALSAATYYVDGTKGSDANAGTTSATAKKTIQAAIDGASSGDLVLVAAGTYAENLVMANKALELRTVGVLDVTVDGNKAGNCLKIDIDCDGTVVDGFVFFNGAPTNSGNKYGGGIDCLSNATIKNCIFKDNGNASQQFGGGLHVWLTPGKGLVTVYNCLFYGNVVYACGGAVLCEGDVTFDRCTFYGNTCTWWNKIGGVGVASDGTATIKNSILYGNKTEEIGVYSGQGKNDSTYSVSYSCVSGGTSGAGNISSDPQFAETNSVFALSAGSPCKDAGDPADLDPDGTRADMGFSADRIVRTPTTDVYGYRDARLFVDATSGNDTNDGTSWTRAKKTIQAAVDVSEELDTILVADGTYEPIKTANKKIAIRSVNGADKTFIDGGGTNRCAYLGDATNQVNTMLSGFTLKNGYLYIADWYSAGAGVRGGFVRNCLITNCVVNGAWGGYGGNGGGAYGSVLEDCRLISNQSLHGGGCMDSLVRRCLISDNYAKDDAGGAWGCEVFDSVVTRNRSSNVGGSLSGSALKACQAFNCTVVSNIVTAGAVVDSSLRNCVVFGNLTASGVADDFRDDSSCTNRILSCWTNAVDFVDAANGDFRFSGLIDGDLEAHPCVNTGDNSAVVSEKDLAGNARIIDSVVDMGAYEFNGCTYKVKNYEGTYDGAVHSIQVTSCWPTDATVCYALSREGPYGTTPIFTPDVCEPMRIWFTVAADGHETVTNFGTVAISGSDISTETVELNQTTFVYDGQPKMPEVRINGEVPTDGVSLAYEDNVSVGTASVVITGKAGFVGEVRKAFTIVPRPVTLTSGTKTDFVYDGTAHEFPVLVKSGNPDEWFVAGEGITTSNWAMVTTVEQGQVDNTFDYAPIEGTDLANYEITVEYGKIAVVKGAIGLYDGEEPGEGDMPDGGLSKFDTEFVYDGEGHTIDTNALVVAFTAALTGSDETKFEYAAGGSKFTATVSDAMNCVPPVFTNAGEYVVWYRVTNPNYVDFVHQARVTILARPIPIPVAVDAEDWTFETGATGGGADWFGQAKVSHDGVDAVRSGVLPGAGETWFETTVTNAGDIAFFWKTSCEPTYDGLSFSVDGETKARLSGVSDGWKELRFEIPSGTHVLRWTYSKDEKNVAGEDCGWVDQVSWTPLAAPAWDETAAAGDGAVTASDGTSADQVSVTWAPFASRRPVIEYELSRAEKGSATWEVLTTGNVLGFADTTAAPGVDYTYRVRARNEAGWGAASADDGWRAYALALGAEEMSFASPAASGTLAVAANAAWTVAASADWISAAVAPADDEDGDGVANAATVSVAANEALEAREGTLTVTVGTGAHAVAAEATVVQSARPPRIDVGFVTPFEDWRTRLQVVTNTTAGDVYAPVSVLLAGDPMSVSFGWTNRSEVAIGVPDVLFKVFDAEGTCVSEWTAEGRSDETLAVGVSTWSAGWPFGVLRVLQPGDYMLRAELAPAPKYADVDRADNVAVFRFAVRDAALSLAGDVFADERWRSPEAKPGNDFAQAPHAAAADVLQFGPYVPMNGVVGRSSNGKQPLDLVFLVDVTGSMWGCINALKENIRQFFDALVTGEDRVTDWRAKVVAYRDITCDSPWYQDWGFTTDPDAMRDEIARCYASGGGDYPESLLDAVYRISTETDFREGAARAVLAFTDASFKTPMSYGAGRGQGWQTAAKAANDAEVVLKLIAPSYVGKDAFTAFAEGCYSTNSEYIAVSSLSSASLSEDMLRQLAKSVSKSVKTTVVEPSLSVSTRGKGTLSFEWNNDSTAGTNNVFTFSCDDGEGNTNLVNAAGSGWQRVSLDLEAGWHLFKWTYGKTDYGGDIVDCGKVRDLAWTPYQTELTLSPTFNEVGHEGARDAETLSDGTAGLPVGGGNQKVTVTCNATWKVVDETVPDWIHVVAGAGDGNGEIWYQVETNALHASRAAVITVRAGDYGLASDDILETTFKVSQKASPYVENGAIQILTVDVKPRWPWNDVIDIDFRVLTPMKEGTPVKVSLVGVNEEGGEMLQYYPALKAAREVTPKTKNLQSSPQGQGLTVGDGYVVCPTSGLYRVTWTDMAKNWYDKYSSIGSYAGWKANGFHTPAFSVRLTGSCDGVATVELPSDPVRVDMRQNPVSGSSSHSTTERSGGAILTGTERIGHPTGAVDPVEVDTTDATLFPSNGWNRLDDIVKDLGAEKLGYSNRYDRACVINDAAIEGGLIVTDTVWRADRVHVVRDNVFVHKDATLTIEDGAVVKFCYNTYLFIYKDSDKTGVEEFNIRMKGCYLTCGYDASYGGNTLYYNVKGVTSDTNEKWNGLSAIPILSNASSGSDLLPQVSSSESRAATRVSLQCKVNGEWKSWKDRFYSREQHWGVLPRPSEEGQEFYGWYCKDPATWLTTELLASKYPASKAFMISASGTPFDEETYGLGTTMTKVTTHFRDGQIFALMCPAGWAESAWDLVDASGAQVVLEPASVVYDGRAHKPSVTRVTVNDARVDPGNYTVTYPEEDCVSVGDYAVSVSFLADYTGHPSATFRVLPRPTDGGAVVTEPASRPYKPASLGGSAKPAVSVSVPGMASVPSGDYEVTWPDAEGRWPRIGVYTVVATFNENYTGPALTNTFEITVNPDYVYAEYGTKEEAVANADGRRILYIGGREGDAMTRHVKDIIRNDTDLNDWVIANFSCWADSVASVADLKFADGLATVETPLLAVLGERDDESFVARHVGYFADAAELKAFLASALDAAEVVDGSGASVTLSRTSAEYDGTVRKPTVTSVALRGETLAEGTDYTVDYGAGDWTSVGTYALKVLFCGAYSGETAERTFEIVPAALTAGRVALDPASATYDGTAHRPSVTPVAGVDFAVDYGTGGYVEVGDYELTVTATGCATGTVVKTFSVAAQPVAGDAADEGGEAVEIVLDVDGAEIRTGKELSDSVRPNVIAVRKGDKTFVAGVDYDVDYGDGDYLSAGTNTITVTFKGRYSGAVSVAFEIVETADATVAVEDDAGAEVGPDPSDPERTLVRPSDGVTTVVVVIPEGVDAAKVTVEVSRTVERVTPHGAAVRVVSGEVDITPLLVLPEADAEGRVDLTAARVVDEVVREVLDPGASEDNVVRWEDGAFVLQTVTRAGLRYVLYEGEHLDAMREGASVTADGTPWRPALTVTGGSSAFYTIRVGK